jgi:hypothetical protein
MYPSKQASGWSSSDGGEARGKSRSWGALAFGGNEAWSEIYTTRVRPLGLQEREKEEERDGEDQRRKEPSGGAPEPDNIPLKDEKAP